MMKLVATALTALAILGGCNSSNQPAGSSASNNGADGQSNGQSAVAEIPQQISGSVSLRAPAAINPGSRLSVQLVDVAQQEVVIAESIENVSSQPPYSFTLPLEPGRIDQSRVYVVNVMLVDGERRYVQALQSPVLTGGAGSTIEVVLNSEATPGENLKEEFNKLKSHIGGMKRIQDAYLDGDLSVAWDGFYEAGNKLRFMRVNSELGEGDTAVRTNIEYAFVDGKPLAILRKGGPVTRVGWDENGEVILNEKGNSDAVTEEEAAALYANALETFAMGEKKLPRKR
ncbi:YbaY family lipoprotein [Dokdonella sp.]|uniref:YbaY family lipoprotein n=1 Tax=Dokdonella sp. TaxID=2291710 RepID=UPI003C62AFD7